MRSIFRVVLVLALAGCGGGSASSGASGSSGSSGSETPVLAGEDEGFDDEGSTTDSSTIDHGTQSAHQLIGVNPPPTPWANMSAQEREDYMVGVFLPISAESFDHYDHSRYAQFECENCHGDDMREQHFRLPSRSLPPLAAPGTPQWERMAATPGYAFMHDTVTPESARMLGLEPYSAEHPDGFGCFNCHPHAQ
jgi:hypothetical protein